MVGLRAKTFHFFRSPLSLQIQNHETHEFGPRNTTGFRALRLNPPSCVIIGIGCRYLSHATRPLKSSTAQPTLRIGKIRLWLNRIKRGKFTFGNSKSERVEGSSRVAPAPLLCTCLLSLPPLLLLYSILSPRFRERRELPVPPRSARYRSARTVYNADAAVFETVYTPTEEYSVYRVLFPNPCTDSGTRRRVLVAWM